MEPFLKNLQNKICKAFEELEPTHRFVSNSWNYEKGQGGGTMRLLRGDVFEKAAVNFSAVSGEAFPGKDGHGPFFATGISLITHMKNPHAPTVHMNIRFIKTPTSFWFGGGYDLSPMGIFYDDDTTHFHQTAKNTLDPFGEEFYPLFSENARAYFYIPHRKKERGVGGIFFDHFNTGDYTRDFNIWQAVGTSFIEAIMPIYRKRTETPFTQDEKTLQLTYRAHYAEFNLIYDKGTKFGLASEGNIEAIFCSLPPLVTW